ncbi:lipo-like protein [Methylocella sp. CPCC 101449]|uniref:lipo-like protein n=1 Tax=Methylocella sp. CPCC 101449 TaxID=2987531 RepID=UPI00288C7BE7|nr:lipo-like protein [Methylocella sp. CPCC 101449]MDT2020317.1 lipo-like protein [Methylocella sp. CPCC 101449]
MLEKIGRWVASYLTQPAKGFMPLATGNPDAFARTLRPGDVVLVEGNTRVATAIKYLTQSTWSHACLYVGPIQGRTEPDGEPHAMIEADMDLGVISIPVSKYANAHTRICRPVGVSMSDVEQVCEFGRSRIGYAYDLSNFFDLFRYFMPIPPVPTRLRRRLLAFGAGEPTRAICSTLIAQAYYSIGYPILPSIGAAEAAAAKAGEQSPRAERNREILHIQHHSLFTPRDFDISPYFAVIKPTLETGFDFHRFILEEEAPRWISS